MFMFQSGLFATFIPEIIMVIAYLMCLFSLGISKSTITSENSNKKINITIIDANEVSSINTFSYQSSIVNNHCLEFNVIHSQLPLKSENRILSFSFANHLLILSEDLSYFQFSRPPPTLLS